jgi:H+/Na+-translocating ferredoxin:NAD+ oxidoreductase subunit G
MAETIFKHAARTAFTLVAFALTFTLLMSVVYQITKEPIAQSEAAARTALFQQVVAQDRYDNDVLKDVISIEPSDLLGNKKPSAANVARMNNEPVAVILEAIAHDGYSGKIKLLVAINHDGSISGVRVLTHSETPGLGDYIDIAKSKWIKLFDGESLTKTSDSKWAVKKDGGQFDYRAGATITPRAVVKAVHKTLQYFNQNKETLLKPAASLEQPIQEEATEKETGQDEST